MIPAVAIVLGISGMIFQASFMAVEHREMYKPAVVLKGCASLLFVIIGICAYSTCADRSFGKMVLLGLIFGAMGDVLLNLRYFSEKHGQKIFLAGIAVFFTGHIMYLIALIPLSDSVAVSFAVGVVIAALLLAYIFKKLTVKIAFKIFGIFYLGAIVIMTVFAIGNYVSVHETARLIFAVGAVLFTVSDVVLIFNTFGDKTTLSRRIINLTCYYIAQLLIACSVFF